jgi:hypothetical protein
MIDRRLAELKAEDGCVERLGDAWCSNNPSTFEKPGFSQ